MSDPKVVKLSPQPIRLDNEDFLREIFGADWERAHVCGFPQDPGNLLPEERHVWGGGPAGGTLPFRGDHNTFFTISVFHPDPVDGRQRRRKVSFDRAYAVVIDDVDLRGHAGTSAKVGADRVLLDPTWVLETSPGNYQLGYALKGGDGRGGKVSALLDALVASGLCPDGTDPGMKGVTRYVRLPVGKNTKAKYGTAGFDHVLSGWHPKRKYTLEEIADAYGVRGEVDAAEDDLGAGFAGSFDPGDDVLWSALLKSGTVTAEDQQKKLLHVTCPFVDEHTGRADSGTAYLGGGRWNCHHGHCVDRSFEDFTAKFREEFPEAWREAVGESFGALGGDEAGVAPSVRERERRDELTGVFGDADMVDDFLAREEEEKRRSKNPMLGSSSNRWSSLQTAQPAPPDFVVPGYVPRGLVTSLYGVDGIGKNMLMQRACMMGVAQGEFLGQPVSRDFKAAFFGVEDPDGAILDRAWRIGSSLGFGAAEWAALDARFVMPELIDVEAKLMVWDREGRAAYGPFLKWLSEFVDAWKPDLVVLDPISDLFEDEESNRQKVVSFMRTLIQFARKKNVGLILLGHPARAEGSEYSGSGAWSTKARSRLFLVRDEGDDDLIWLRHRKVSYGSVMGDRECRFNGAGVLEDRPAAGGGAGAGRGRGVQLSDLGDALRELALMGEVASAKAKAQNNFGKLVRDHGLIPGASPQTVNNAVREAIKSGFLVGNHAFDGSAGSPDIRYANRSPRVGLWFAP